MLTVDRYGNRQWHNSNDELHREDGPAVERSSGSKAWYKDGKLHREDSPAFEHVNGYRGWYLNGEYHRTNGPAREYADGSKEWYLNGVKCTEESFLNISKIKGE